ncbi:response regulator [Aquimarina sp. D1M17]|uniref:tetratricopeptide repeat-containing hybrid sensor histidine kinase/response regulator n=1 Tax=Aquimarina acroporae TaxID=2937283 RepID=UPI0020BDD700|nr:response regulator [Aquimarina acroporae]MCK8520520.1 response regulator [Aquimarina acroporae]
MKTFLLIVHLVVVGSISYGQIAVKHNHIDSLHSLIDQSNSLTYEYKIKESLEYAIKAANYAYEVNNDHYKAKAYYLMAYNYEILVDFKNAEEYYRKSLKFSEVSNDSLLVLWNNNGLGNVYSDGYKDLKTSLVFYNKAKELGKNFEDSSEYMTPVINLAWTYVDIGEFDDALPYIEEAQKLVVEHKDIEGYCEVYYLRGKYALHKKNFKDAFRYFEEAIDIAEGHDMVLELSYILKARAALHEKVGDTISAYNDIKEYQQYKDKLYDKEKLKQIEVASISFAVDEYKRELEIANKEKDYQASIAKNNKIILFISVIGLIFMLGTAFFFYLGYRSKKKLSDILKEKNTQLEVAKTEAEKLTNTKSQFISTVSHELRTPLYGVVGITSLLLEDKEMPSKHKKLLNSLKFSGDYLLDLINKVLKISKIESNKEKLTKTPTDLSQLAQNLLYSFEYQAKNKNNQLVLESQKELPKILSVDSLKLSEILINLIGNSVKFTENGTIWLRLKIVSIDKEKVKVKFEVEDNGLGIPEDKKEFVFEKFSQLGREINKSEGTGLGLSIVKNLLEMMGSQIYLDSKEGRGTKFYFDLEFEVINEKESSSLDLNKEESPQTFKKILVAEDNKINQIVTKNLLDIIGYNSTIVENGLNALQMVKKEEFDLILMDLNMPYLDGIEATKRIREFDQETPIIALTASELSEVQEECLAIGMNDIINKPLNKDDLREILSKNLI